MRYRYLKRGFLLIAIITMVIMWGLIVVVRRNSSASTSSWQESPLLPQGLRTDMLHLNPGFSGISETTGITYTVNNWGYRDDPIDWTKQHVVFLGDSTTFGLNVEHEDTYAEVWERLAGDNWQAINTATPGHGTITEYAELKKVFERGVRPEWIVVGFHVSDLRTEQWDNTSWENSAKFLKGIRDIALQNDARTLIIYLPNNREPDVLKGSRSCDVLHDFAVQEGIDFIDVARVYNTYLDQHGLTEIPETFYSHDTDMTHPGILSSRLIGEALAETISPPGVVSQ